VIPEKVRLELLSVVGDLRLFKSDWPPKMIMHFMVVSNGLLKEHDEQLHNQVLTTILALFPKMEGEQLPEGLTMEQLAKFASYMLDDIYKKLEAAAPPP
jgi:hypothetical protein